VRSRECREPRWTPASASGGPILPQKESSVPFIAKLAALSPLLAYLLIIAFFIGFGLALALAIRRFSDFQTRRTHNDIAGYIFTTIGAIYAVLLAFITVIIWQQYNNAAENAAIEATTAMSMYRNLSLYPDQEQAGKAAQSLLAFMHAAVEDEFPAMAKMKRSQATMQAMDALWVNAKKIKPQNLQEQALFNEILKDLNNIAQLRAGRLGAATNPKLAGVMRITLIFGALITIGFAVLFGAENFWWHIIYTALMAVLIATILFVLMELEHPFTSGIAIQSNDYTNVLQMIKIK
jgi:hypothetical protein